MAEGCALRQTGNAEPHTEPCEQRDTDEFADDEAKHHAEGDVARDCILEGFRGDLDPRVHQGEQRDDQVRAERVKEVGETLGHRQLFSDLEVGSSDHSRVRLAGDRRPHMGVVGGVDARVGGVGTQRMRRADEPEDDAGDRGVDARLENRQPQDDTHEHVERDVPDAGELHQQHQGDESDGGKRPADRKVGGVEDRDDDDRADVVDDGKGQEKDLHRLRNTITEQGDDADGEGNVGGHRDAPTVGADPASVEGEEDQGRHDHAAERGHRRECGSARVGEFAADEFLLDFEPDDEEEDNHQGIVDPRLKRLVDREQRAKFEADVEVDEGLVGVLPRRVGPHQRNDGGEDQEKSGGRLDLQKITNRAAQRARQTTVAAEPCEWRRFEVLRCHDVGNLPPHHPKRRRLEE